MKTSALTKTFLSMTVLVAATTLSALDINWRGDASEALAAPKIQTGAESYQGQPVIAAEAVADGDYQGLTGTFHEPVDLAQFSGVRFYVRNNFLASGACVFRLNCRPDGGIPYGIYTDFTVTDQWTEVTIPFNPTLWHGPEGKVSFGQAASLTVYPYQAMNRTGNRLEIAGFRFLAPDNTPAPLTVQAYKYINAPDSGDPAGKALTDGSLATQAFWRQYSDDAEIVFDLGGIFAVTGIEVEADSIPAHNFSELRVTAGTDGKDYYPVGILHNTNTDTVAAPHTVRFDGKAIGRYFRFRAVKPRPDFQVYLGEVRFTGYIPTAAEEQADAVNRYVIGPDMPPRDSNAYAQTRLGDFTLWIDKTNGVINGVQFRDQLWIERLVGRYVLQDRASDRVISGYDDQLAGLKVADDAVEFTVTNPGLPGIELAKRYELDPTGALLETVRVHADATLPREFLQVATEVILNQDFRKTGVYETSGAVHAMTRAFAPEIRMETEVCNIPFLSFENAAKNVTMLHERLRANGEFIYFDAVVEEARLLSLLANGWRMPLLSGVPADSGTKELSGTLRLSITDGGLLQAYDNYLSHPDVAGYRARIHRPAWLRDQLIHGDPGWDGLCQGVSERFFENQKRLFARGRYILSGRADLDFVWGEFPTEGVVEDWFGGRKEAGELADLMQNLRTIYPGLKLGLYSWVWSSFPYQKIVREHPDWFVAKTRSGAVASWFPGVNTNWMRFWNEASTDEAVTSLMAMVRRYKCDNWYLDGGNAGPYAKDFDRMRLDDPAGPTKFYWRMRDAMQQYDPESFLVFNATLNPIADVGILESFSGTMTSEWRRGAAWMWKFKMIQYHDPLRTPIYIYWLPNVDGAFHNYMVGTGLMPTAISRDINAGEVPYISARYEVRQLALTDAKPRPDWRSDDATDTETMTLTQGNAGFVFVNHHGKTGTVEVSADTAPLGLTDPARPVHEWEMTIRDGKSWKGWWGQPDLIAGYKQSRWIGESALIPCYRGSRTLTPRLARSFQLEPGQAKMWVLTQCPAVIWSLDDLPSQYRIPSTPGAAIAGDYPNFTFDTEYAANEIAFVIPAGRRVETVTRDGQPTSFRYGRDGDALFAIVPVAGAGHHALQVRLAELQPATDPGLRVEARVDGSRLTGQIHGNTASPVTVSIYSDNALCFTDTVTMPDGKFAVTLPVTTKDGTYEIVAVDLSGRHRASTSIAISGIGRRTALLELMPYIAPEIAVTPVAAGNGVSAVATEFTPTAAYATADAETRQLAVGTLPAITTYYSSAIAGIEFRAQRYIELELSGNLRYYNLHGQEPKRHFVRIDCPEAVAALLLDFHTPEGYAARTLAGLGQQYLERGAAPDKWGAGRAPDNFYALCNFIQDTEHDSLRFWIDTHELGAPANWDGQLWLTLAFQVGAPNRQLAVKILDTADTLPPNAELLRGLNLRGTVEHQTFHVQSFPAGTVVSDDWDAPAWQTIAELPPMTVLATPGVPAPFATRSRAAKDDRNLYLLIRCQDEPGRILETERGAIGQPWFSDSIEFWIQDAPGTQTMLHAVVDAANHGYAEKARLNKAQESQSEELKTLPFTASVRRQSDAWTILVTLPLAQFGGSPVAFNLMRNRMQQGNLANYTTVPGNNYFCGEVYFLELKP